MKRDSSFAGIGPRPATQQEVEAIRRDIRRAVEVALQRGRRYAYPSIPAPMEPDWAALILIHYRRTLGRR